MYTIIYQVIKEESTEIKQILNGLMSRSSWQPGDSGLEFKNCSSHAELVSEANALDPNWETKFSIIYIKK